MLAKVFIVLWAAILLVLGGACVMVSIPLGIFLILIGIVFLGIGVLTN